MSRQPRRCRVALVKEYAAIGAQVRRQLLDALDSWAQEVQAAAEDVDCI
ncbi:MAG: hypothetical protein QOI53_4513 [Verrucomicrobiota bacterium]|jgi:hypothetical protein|nr:hypothetical protein [Verrucomicrobiota bacterium]